MKALLIPVDPTVALTLIEVNPNDFDGMAEAIGARYVEFVRTPLSDHRLVVDELGLLIGKTLNLRASALYPTGIVGDALLVGWDVNVDPLSDQSELTDATVEPHAYEATALGAWV